MQDIKEVPFSDFLEDVKRADSNREYMGFRSRDGRLVEYRGVSYCVELPFLEVKYKDGTASRNHYDGTGVDTSIGYEETPSYPGRKNDLFALYQEKK